jgi:hypothetical protein
MNDDGRYGRFMDEFGAELARAATRAAARRARRRRATVGGLAAAAALAAVLVLVGFGGGAGRRLDVVAQARAALSPPQEIVHMVVTTSAVARRGVRVPPPNTTEQWSAVDPPRWRLVQNIPPPNPKRGIGSVGDAHGTIVGRQEFAYANGKQLTYVARRNALTIYRGFSDSGAAAHTPGLFSNDPVAGLRSMLVSGKLRDVGEVTTAGRTVRRLFGEERTPQPKGRTFVRRVTYDVDPRTFAPLQGTLEFDLAHGTTLAVRFHVDRYERLPLTPRNAKLLTIRTNPQTKVTVHRVGRRR